MKNDKDEIVVFEEEYMDDEKEEKVAGIGIVIDGKLKGVMDKLLLNHPELNGYTDLAREAFYRGIIDIIRYGLQ